MTILDRSLRWKCQFQPRRLAVEFTSMADKSRVKALRLRINLASGRAVGPGKIDLLELIGRTGSLSEAARGLRMSYRRAWLLLDDLNHSFAAPVATTKVGGSGGGGARLTPLGERLIAAYRSVEGTAERAARVRFREL
jgi:molybdate transport system regulatory protein